RLVSPTRGLARAGIHPQILLKSHNFRAKYVREDGDPDGQLRVLAKLSFSIWVKLRDGSTHSDIFSYDEWFLLREQGGETQAIDYQDLGPDAKKGSGKNSYNQTSSAFLQ
ncbi:MAG: hypothetical protein O3A92_16430, partial [Verrucomicrobia bacterium]|nr:hypothetical protein [Verrucomicrobiota bacterium]